MNHILFSEFDRIFPSQSGLLKVRQAVHHYRFESVESLRNAPVLLIGHSRPDLVSKQLSRLSSTNRSIYVFVDGPRDLEDERVYETQAAVLNFKDNLHNDVQLKNNIHILFLENNLGCKWGPITAINWAFENENEMIILEDDIEYNSVFLEFMDWALTNYRHQKTIQHINGYLPPITGDIGLESIFFSRHVFGWGWATWKDRWKTLDPDLLFINSVDDLSEILQKNSFGTNHLFRKMWWVIVQRCKNGHDAWDYQWTLSMWRNRRLALTPSRSLTQHLGIGEASTHFRNQNPSYSLGLAENPELADWMSKDTKGLKLEVERNVLLDHQIDLKLYGVYTRKNLASFIFNLPKRLRRVFRNWTK